MTEDQWTQKVGPARQELGALVSRKVKSAKYLTSVPGAPDGEYVVIQYRSSFEHKKSAVETVTQCSITMAIGAFRAITSSSGCGIDEQFFAAQLATRA